VLNKSLFIFALMFALSFMTVAMQEEETQTLYYGDVLEVEFPKDAKEVKFVFTGKIGDVIVVDATVETLNGLLLELQLLDDHGSTLVDTKYTDTLETFRTLSSVIPFSLPKDGEYTIIVANLYNDSLDENVPFTIRLLQPEILKIGNPVEGTADNEFATYYTVISRDPFGIIYQVGRGNYHPALFIDRIENGVRERLAVVYGNSLLSSTLAVMPNRNIVHLISIEMSPYDVNFSSNRQVNYSLELIEVE
jgi:hypothetical protein